MIIYQSRIYRSDLQANRQLLYIFGDNSRRVGLGGQAKEMRGEINAHGVATKLDPGTYFCDSDFAQNVLTITKDLEKVSSWLAAGNSVVFPRDGIGTGLSALPEMAPRTWAFLCHALKALGINPQVSA